MNWMLYVVKNTEHNTSRYQVPQYSDCQTCSLTSIQWHSGSQDYTFHLRKITATWKYYFISTIKHRYLWRHFEVEGNSSHIWITDSFLTGGPTYKMGTYRHMNTHPYMCTHVNNTKWLESTVFQYLIGSICNNYTIKYHLNWYTNHNMSCVGFQHHKVSHEKSSH